MDLSNVYLFPGGQQLTKEAVISEEDVGVIKWLDTIKLGIDEGNVRRGAAVLLDPFDNPVSVWCNLDRNSLEPMAKALIALGVQMEKYMAQIRFDEPTGIGE